MEELFLSRTITSKEIQVVLKLVMPALTAFECNLIKGDYSSHFDFNSSTHILYEIEADSISIPNFPYRLSIYRTPNEGYEERQLWLGQMLSAQYHIDAWVSFTHPDNPTDPYYGIVFQDGQSYLADDSEIDVENILPKPLKIIGPYHISISNFDSFGSLVNTI